MPVASSLTPPSNSIDVSAAFSADPLTMTVDDPRLRLIVENFRARRKQFLLGNMTAGRTKPPSAKEKESLKAIGELDI